jgi:hypothetical protein
LAEAFLEGRGKRLEQATQADLEDFLADILRLRSASTAATRYKVLRVLSLDDFGLSVKRAASLHPLWRGGPGGSVLAGGVRWVGVQLWLQLLVVRLVVL